MKLPDIDLKELKELKARNFKERLEFIEKYASWIKNNPGWDKEQQDMMG